MKILAIESSAVTASVALMTDDVLTAEYTVNYKKTHSQTLLPMIDQICSMTDTVPESIDCVAVSVGPGSFTGLRIGVATAKGIALAHKLPVVAVPTLEAMAYNYIGSDAYICPVMDARRDHVYGAVYRFNGDGLETVVPQGLYSAEEIIDKINSYDGAVILGDGVAVIDKYKEKLSGRYSYAPANLVAPRASSVAVLGLEMYNDGKSMKGCDVVPDYIRPSQAERELEGRHENYKTYG